MGVFQDATMIVCAWQPCCVNIGSTRSTLVAASQRPVYRRSAWIDREEVHCKLPCNLMPNVACLLVSNTHSRPEVCRLKNTWFFFSSFTKFGGSIHSWAVNIIDCCHGEEIGSRGGEWRATQTVMRRNFSVFLQAVILRKCVVILFHLRFFCFF